jgi:hypothetical protein
MVRLLDVMYPQNKCGREIMGEEYKGKRNKAAVTSCKEIFRQPYGCTEKNPVNRTINISFRIRSE